MSGVMSDERRFEVDIDKKATSESCNGVKNDKDASESGDVKVGKEVSESGDMKANVAITRASLALHGVQERLPENVVAIQMPPAALSSSEDSDPDAPCRYVALSADWKEQLVANGSPSVAERMRWCYGDDWRAEVEKDRLLAEKETREYLARQTAEAETQT